MDVAGDPGSLDVDLTVLRPKRLCSKPKWMTSGDYVVGELDGEGEKWLRHILLI